MTLLAYVGRNPVSLNYLKEYNKDKIFNILCDLLKNISSSLFVSLDYIVGVPEILT